jgi:hypothetical protein
MLSTQLEIVPCIKKRKLKKTKFSYNPIPRILKPKTMIKFAKIAFPFRLYGLKTCIAVIAKVKLLLNFSIVKNFCYLF